MVPKEEEVLLSPGMIGQSLCQFRTITTKRVDAMRRSMKRHGQLSPVAIAALTDGYEMVDGFKRLRAAKDLPEVAKVRCRIVSKDVRTAKIAMFCLNQQSTGLNEMETALLLQSLYRTERMAQADIASALGRTKTWVCRRLQLVEKLSQRAQEDIRVGLLPQTAARYLVKLPRGNQERLLNAMIEQRLSTREVSRVVKLYEAARSKATRIAILDNPKGALNAKGGPEARLSGLLTPQGRRILRNVLLMERIGGGLLGYLEAEPWQEDPDLPHLRTYFARLARITSLLQMRLQDL